MYILYIYNEEKVIDLEHQVNRNKEIIKLLFIWRL